MDSRPKGSPDSPESMRGDSAVDVSLIDEMLRMTPLERLQQNDRMVKTIAALRSAFATRQSRREQS